MKKKCHNMFFAVMIFLLPLNPNLNAQVYNGDLTLTTQAQVDSFNFTTVTGNLLIKESMNKGILNLFGLSELESVGGNLLITENDTLNLIPLSNLSRVGGNLEFSYNTRLLILYQLNRLSFVGGSLIINNNNVQTLFEDEFGSRDDIPIDTIGGSLIITYDSVGFTGLGGLNHITYIGQNLIINQTRLSEFNALENVTVVGGNINITNNPRMDQFCGLYKLLSSGSFSGSLTITGNMENPTAEEIIEAGFCTYELRDNLYISTQEEIDRFNFYRVEGTITIDDGLSGNIKNLSGMSVLTSAGSLVIKNTSALTTLQGLNNLRIIVSNGMFFEPEGLVISNNTALINVDGLNNLNSTSYFRPAVDPVNGPIIINNNPKLVDLQGFESLEIIHSLSITDNESLENFCGLYPFISLGLSLGFDNTPYGFEISGNAANPTKEEILEGGFCIGNPKSFIAVLLGENEVPPVETDASGGGMFILNETQDSLWFWIRVCELECPLIASHFHVGAPGVPGPVVRGVTLTPDTMVSYFANGVWTSSDAQPLTPALVTELLNGNIYFNVHSTGHLGGEIRGQLTSDQPVELFANLDGSQETPPVMTMGSGEGHFTLSGDGDSLWYHVTSGNLSGPIAASHFHNAAFGVPGPVVRGISFVGDSVSEGVWTNMDAQPLTPSLVADLLGCFIYANIHTQQHPAGEIRGQLYKTESMMKQYMTIWAAENDADANQDSKLNFYSLAEGKQFLNREGDITGYNGEKRIADLTIDIGGNIYFLNNTWTSMIYRIKASAIDLDGSTPVYAKQIGRTRTFPDEKLVWLSHIQFIRGKLYGLDNKTNKLYEINQYNAYVKEIADLSSLEKEASGFALGADGNVYLLKTLDQSRSEIWKFDSFPGNSLSLVTGISSLDILESFASHPNGKLYASDKSNLYEIDLSQRTVGVLKDHQVSISAMDFDTYTEKTVEAKPTVAFTDISSVTDVDGFTGIPTQYSLSQNYPNPFNPNTTIKYTLPEGSFVKLKVYNSLGELVKTLVSETKDAGYYEISFDASSLSSGMYIYKIEAGNFVSSSKMILLK